MNTKLPTLRVATPSESEPPLLGGDDHEERGVSLKQIAVIVLAHWKISLLTTITLAALFSGVIKLLPKSYDATATLIVNYESSDPLAESAFPAGYMDSYIATQIEIMQSTSVMEKVITELQLTKQEEFSGGFKSQGSLTDWVKSQLLKKLSFRHTGGTQLVYVNATSRSAELAAQIANSVANAYLSQERERLNEPAMERANSYSARLSELKEKVDAAQERVTKFRQENKLTDVTASNSDAEVGVLNMLESRYQEALNVERTAMVSKATQQDISRATSQSMVIQGLRSQLSTQQAQMAEYLSTYGSKHPKVIELQSQIDATKTSIDTETKALSHGSNLELNTVRDLAAKLKPAVDAQRAKVLALRRQQDEGAKLLLELESAQAVYKRALDGYDKVMSAASGTSSNVRLMSSAEVPVKSTKPNKLKLFILALGAAGFFGFAVPFGYDFFLQRKIRCRDDIERDLGIPALIEFNRIPALGDTK